MHWKPDRLWLQCKQNNHDELKQLLDEKEDNNL